MRFDAPLPAILESLRARQPLVQCITNYVAMDAAANALLALGASPAMVHDPHEAGEFAAFAAAVTVNIGTLSPDWVEGMKLAIATANRLERPWVLDPVGMGATAYRSSVGVDLVGHRPTLIRGNASEIIALAHRLIPDVAGSAGRVKGVEAGDPVEAAVEPAVALAGWTGKVVAVTGPTDIATDGRRVVRVAGGSALMPRITAMGCALTACAGASLAAAGDPLAGTVAALAIFKAAAARAAVGAEGPASLRTRFIDALHTLEPAALAEVDVTEG